jgi:hypothetical protein
MLATNEPWWFKADSSLFVVAGGRSLSGGADIYEERSFHFDGQRFILVGSATVEEE